MDREELPKYSRYDEAAGPHRLARKTRRQRRNWFRVAFIVVIGYVLYAHAGRQALTVQEKPTIISIEKLQAQHAQCTRLQSVPKDPSGHRDVNARWNGAKPTLIKNTTIWTGEAAAGTTLEEQHHGIGYSWVRGDVLIEKGLIKQVASSIKHEDLPKDCVIHDGSGRLLTAGIVDMHSHTGVYALPSTKGGSDGNELSSDTTPYVKSIDGLDPHDHQIQVIKSGGVTTSLILPGSGNNMGGEAFVIKHAVGPADGRPELSVTDMLADPEHTWRYMKMACGENAKNVYGQLGRDFGPFSRLGEAWYFRHAFDQARKLVESQDDWCAAADRLGAENMSGYLPEDLQWESLGALLRGQVLLNTHCYTVTDLESFIRHTNEFKFSVRAFHHAHQTYLVPEVLKRNYGGRPPAAALFADNMYYKTESYIGSEQAGKILYENGITPVYVSDNPVINAQHVLFEAAKAYKNGLPYHVALAGVTSASAELLGLGERIGKVKAGFDGDLALWDSDPLSVGATPVQVWIDGEAQFRHPVELKKPSAEPILAVARPEPLDADFDPYDRIIFANVSAVMLPGRQQTLEVPGYLVVDHGKISCIGACRDLVQASIQEHVSIITLKDGHVVPPATSFGSFLGLEEVAAEPEMIDGRNTAESFSTALDGLALEGKALSAAYAHGVTRAISAPSFSGGGHRGVSVGFRVAAQHALEKHAVFSPAASVHYPLGPGARGGNTPSMSSAVGALHSKLIKALSANETELDAGSEAAALSAVVRGKLPLVVDTNKADVIASLLRIKKDIDRRLSDKDHASLRLIILGAAEAHLVATELAEASVDVVLAPPFPYATRWDERRSLTGAPLTNGTAIDVLHAAGVRLVLGTAEDWETRDMYLMAGIATINSNGKISIAQALAMISSNVDEILGLKIEASGADEFVIFEGNPLSTTSRLRAVADGRGRVDVWRETA